MGSRKSISRRILIIAPEPVYSDRGSPIAVRHVIKALTECGNEVDLLTYPIGEDFTEPGLRIFRIPNPFQIKKVPIGFSACKLLLDVMLIPAIWNRLLRDAYVCIHAVEEAAFPALIAGRWMKVPVVYDMQSSLPEQLKAYPVFRGSAVRKGLRWCERWLLRHADLVVCSAGLENYVKKVEPSTPVMEWYFPGQRIEVRTDEVNQLREELRISTDSPVVLYTGNFEPYQELDRVLEAAPKILSCFPKAVFVLVGGSDSDRLDLSPASRNLVNSGSLRLLPRKPRSEVSKFLAMANVLVSPRENLENLPLKIFDYLEAGKPIVAIDSPTTRTVLDDDRAVLVNSRNGDLGEAVTQLLQNPERANRLGMAARGYADQYLGWEAFVEQISEIQERLLGEKRNTIDPTSTNPFN